MQSLKVKTRECLASNTRTPTLSAYLVVLPHIVFKELVRAGIKVHNVALVTLHQHAITGKQILHALLLTIKSLKISVYLVVLLDIFFKELVWLWL